MNEYDLVIVGGGPAGMSSAIYGTRAGLTVVIIEMMGMGGQIGLTSEVENYPGVMKTEGIILAGKMGQQVKEMGVEIVYDQVNAINLDNKIITTDYSGEYKGKAIMLGMGATPRLIGIDGEMMYTGRGISYCAICDGSFFKDKTVAVFGGGNTAVEDALYLERICKKVYIIHRRNELRASKTLSDTIINSTVEIIWDSVISELKGEKKLTSITVTNKNGENTEIELDGLFIAIGRIPRTQMVKGQVELDEMGYIKADCNMSTSRKGVYAIGDIREKLYRQIVTATADGAIASLHANSFLNEN